MCIEFEDTKEGDENPCEPNLLWSGFTGQLCRRAAMSVDLAIAQTAVVCSCFVYVLDFRRVKAVVVVVGGEVVFQTSVKESVKYVCEYVLYTCISVI